eukprot:6211019-Pleurochrysis_carterae.AAC.5
MIRPIVLSTVQCFSWISSARPFSQPMRCSMRTFSSRTSESRPTSSSADTTSLLRYSRTL